MGLSYLAGLVFFFISYSWILAVEGVKVTDYLAMGLYLGAFIAIFGVAYSTLSKILSVPGILLAPALWVCIEFAWSHTPIVALPMVGLGYSQYIYPEVIQLSAVTGQYGVSFLIVMANTAIAELITRTRGSGWYSLIALIAISSTITAGAQILNKAHTDSYLRSTVIQGNISQRHKWEPELLREHLAKHIQLTNDAEKAGHAELVIWPESSVPLGHDPALFDIVAAVAADTGSFLLTGSAQQPKAGGKGVVRAERIGDKYIIRLHNTAYLIDPHGKLIGTYAKRRLVPFSEYLPVPDLPWPDHWRSSAGYFLPGEEATVFNIGDQVFGVAICWEMIFPDLIRDLAVEGANFVVNIGNEAWFGNTGAPYQFLASSVFRAVENRIAVARAVNTGISGFIDPWGRILQIVSKRGEALFVEGTSTVDLPIVAGRTFYSRYGDMFAYLNTLGVVIMIMMCVYNRLQASFRVERVQ